MTDDLSRVFASYVVGDLEVTPDVRREARRRILDSVGVAMAALDQPGPRAARAYAAAAFPNGGDATVWGSDRRVPAEVAGLINGVAVRCLDYNDNYFSLNGGHPSDIIGALVAVAESRRSTGRELLEAVAVGYEVGAAINDSFALRRRGWDQTTMTGVAAWGGVARLLRLSDTQAADALAMTVVPRVGLGQARYGNVAMWKGFAGPDAARFAIYAGLLAEAGVQGPFEPLEGPRGFIAQLLDGVIDHPEGLQGLRDQRSPTGILRGNMKAWPVGSVAQSAVSAAVTLQRRLESGEQVQSVTVSTFAVAIEVMCSAEKWSPRTRETADHSLPYVVAAALRHGEINEETFSAARFGTAEMHRFLQDSVKVIEDPELSQLYPRDMPAVVEVTTTRGRTLRERVDSAPGSMRNPFSDADLEEKFRRNAADVLGDRSEPVIEAVAGLEEAPGAGHLVGLLGAR